MWHGEVDQQGMTINKVVTVSGGGAVVDCNGTTGLRFQGNLSQTLTLRNVILQNCNSSNEWGGGMWLKGIRVQMSNVVVRDCTTLQQGGGMYLDTCQGKLWNVTIMNNAPT